MRRKIESQALYEESQDLATCLSAFILDVELRLDISLTRDALEVVERTANEGLGYLGLVLPQFWSWFVESLDAGELCQPLPRFKRARFQADRPAFLQELTNIVFGDDGKTVEPGDNSELADRIATVVKSINTICNAFGKKYEAPLEDDVKEQLLQDFKDTDTDLALDLGEHILDLPLETQRVVTYARNYLVQLFEPYQAAEVVRGVKYNEEHTLVVRDFWNMPFKPRFGPGACYERYDAYGKYFNLFANPPLKAIGSLGLFDVCNPSYSVNTGVPPRIVSAEALKYMAGDERLVITTIVPKTLGKGREICPQENDFMFLQKGYQEQMYQWVESHPLTAGFVNFTDQTINGRLALRASADRSMATLDMKKASNLVTRGHVGVLFDQKMSQMLLSLRNDRIGVVDRSGKVDAWNMNMYAPMGSALCFPVEALVFWAIAKAALDVAELPGNRDVYVFGDDVLVPTSGYEAVCRAFSAVGFMVNLDKSFVKGYFRESCGVDAYRGRRVDPTFRISKRVPNRVQSKDSNSSSVAAWVAYANMAEAEDNIFLAEAIRQVIRKAYPKSRAFPETGEIQETSEGYLAFFVHGKPSQRDVIAEKVMRPHAVYETVQTYPLIIKKKWVGGHKIYDELMVNLYVPKHYGAQGTFFGPNVQAPRVRRFIARSQEMMKVKESTDTVLTGSMHDLNHIVPSLTETDEVMPDNLAYLRWVLERPENVYKFPVANTLDIARATVTLS